MKTHPACHQRKAHEKPLRPHVQQLIECTVSLSRSYAVWWELVDMEKMPDRELLVENHKDFFVATAEAHFQLLCVGLYQVFDKRKRTVSVPNLLKELAGNSPDLAEQLKTLIEPHREILKKVFHIRGNVYAHRNAALHPEQIFKEASLSPNALGAVVSVVEKVVAALAAWANIDNEEGMTREFCHRANFARDDLRLLLTTAARNGTF